MKKSTELMLQQFVIRTIMVQENPFTEKQIVSATFRAYSLSTDEKKVAEGIVKDSIANMARSGMIKRNKNTGSFVRAK